MSGFGNAGGFANSIAGFNGTLIRQQLQSQNFVPNVSGWAIFRNGNAQFNQGTFLGSVIVEGANGVFVYSGTPALGNLIISIAGQAGVDPYGNAYGFGLQGSVVLQNANGVFAYSGVPAFGNLDVAIAGQAGTDNYGNSFGAGLNVYYSGTSQRFFRADPNLNGAQMIGEVTAIVPGTAGPPTTETWHTPTITGAGWTTTGIGHPLRYRMEGIAGGIVRLDGAVQTTGAGPWPANTAIITLLTGYPPSAAARAFVTPSAVLAAAGGNTVNVQVSGDVRNGVAFTAINQVLFFDGITFPVD